MSLSPAMKTIILYLMGCCWYYTTSIAQPQCQRQQCFQIESHAFTDSISKAILNRQYERALSLVDRWLGDFRRLSTEIQTCYRQWEINAHYIQTCIYADKNDIASAVTCFDTAVGLGFKNYQQANSDKHLDPLRTDNRFTELLDIVRTRGDYLFLLQQSEGYSDLPTFSYRHDSELLKLRSDYHLDSVTSHKKDEISKIIALLHWAHGIVPHDGTKNIPEKRNAESLIEYHNTSRSGLDCRGLATILNEAYLAMGFASRILTCLPKDTSDTEHHVITAVYSEHLGKWLWMDPTYDTYISDETGKLLGVDEVRHALIDKHDLHINPEASIAGKTITAHDYLYGYIAKNIYWFQSPTVSSYDSETEQRGKEIDYVALVPKGYLPFGSKQQKLRNGVAYFTTNGNYFWQPPPEVHSGQ